MLPTAWRGARRALFCAAVFVVSGFGAALAHAGGTNTVSAQAPDLLWEASAVDQPIARGALPPISLGDGPGSVNYAFASGQTLTLRSAVAGHDSESLNHASTARTEWTFTVDAGTSGLTAGAPITVLVDLRVDGGLAAGMRSTFLPPAPVGFSPDFRFEASAAVGLDLRLVDIDSPDYEPGAWSAEFYLGASAGVSSAWYSAYGGNPEQQYTTWGHGANGFAYDNQGFWSWYGSDSDYDAITSVMPAQELFDFDSGTITLRFGSFVGNRVTLEASLRSDLYCLSYNASGSTPGCAGQADFAHSFDAELSSTTAGIEFGGVTPGVAPAVPEPTTPLLWLAGGAALLVWRRRSRSST